MYAGQTTPAAPTEATPSPSVSPSAASEAQEPVQYLLTLPLRILAIVLGALVLIAISNVLIARIVRRLNAKIAAETELADDSEPKHGRLWSDRLKVLGDRDRRHQRIAAVGSLLKSLVAAIITAVAVLTILPILGIDIGPLLVSASVLGVALGFGAQNLIKDYLAGVFIVMEDQYGLGDVIETGGLIGTVEEVGLRVTRIRDLTGVVWYLRNGELLQVGNRSQGWTLATADIPISPKADLDTVRDVVAQEGQAMMDHADAHVLLEAPYFAGVESVSSQATVVRIAAKAAPDKQLVVSRQLRERMRAALEQRGVDIAMPPMVVPPPVQP